MDALRPYLEKIDAWILEQAGIEFDARAEAGKLLLVAGWGCKNFCVNGQLAGNCCTSMEMQINDRHERIDRQPAG